MGLLNHFQHWKDTSYVLMVHLKLMGLFDIFLTFAILNISNSSAFNHMIQERPMVNLIIFWKGIPHPMFPLCMLFFITTKTLTLPAFILSDYHLVISSTSESYFRPDQHAHLKSLEQLMKFFIQSFKMPVLHSISSQMKQKQNTVL